MKATILISRIMRVIETEGAVGDGSSLAEEYSAAVRRVNARLEAVQASIEAKQVSEAVRMIEDAPRLLDEVGALDFNRLPDWEVLCARHKWTPPQRLDRSLLERVLMFSESTDVVEPFLRMYRKAVRTNDDALAVQSLRRLVQVDHSQNWKVNLLQSEEAVQKRLTADFRAARSSGNGEEADRLAQEFAEAKWSEPPTPRGTEEIRAYIAEKEAKRRDVEGAEDLSIIRRCMDGDWSLPLAFSMLQAIDGLVEKGLALSADDRDIVDSCRRRCADEMEAEAQARRWKALCEQLHAAIQQENVAAIRDALSEPEFLDREPDPDLMRQAQLVIQHEEAARKRKMLQISVCAMAGLFAILGVSGWWLRQKLLDDRCEGEAVKLAALQKGSHAVDRLTEALRKLQKDDPDVFADPRVNVFEGRLRTMKSQMDARTNEIASALAELKALKAANWGDSVVAVTNRIKRIDAIIAKDDDALKADFLKLKAAWSDRCDEVDAENRKEAARFHETLVSRVKAVVGRLKTEPVTDDLSKEIGACKASIEEWKRVHAQHAPSLEGAVDEAEKSLGEAEAGQRNLQEAIRKMNDAASAKEFLEARKALVDFYSDYPFVKDVGGHPVAAEDAAAVVDGSSDEQKAYKAMFKAGVDEATFKAFIADNVLSLRGIPSYYSLYGISMDGVYKTLAGVHHRFYLAMCKGKPRIKKTSYSDNYQIDGELLDLWKGAMVQQMSGKSNKGLSCEPLLPSEEIKNVVSLAERPSIDLFKFEQEILKIVAGHLKEAGGKDFLKDEVETFETVDKFVRGRYPAIRRVQLLQVYFTWLKDDLKLMPQDGVFSRWLDRVEDLAQPVLVDNVPEDLTWTCMGESRVRRRNSDCARLLSQMASQKFVDRYQAWKRARSAFRKLTQWKVEYAGCNAYDPYRRAKDRSVVIPSVPEDVKRDHPLYVLRREDGKLTLKKALVPHKNGTEWAVAPGMAKEFVPGDPLFQVSDGEKRIDAEEAVREILKGVSDDVSKQFAAKIPLFRIEVK